MLFDTCKLLFLCFFFGSADSMFTCFPSNHIFLFTSFPFLPCLPYTHFVNLNAVDTFIPPSRFVRSFFVQPQTSVVLRRLFLEKTIFKNQLVWNHMKPTPFFCSPGNPPVLIILSTFLKERNLKIKKTCKSKFFHKN